MQTYCALFFFLVRGKDTGAETDGINDYFATNLTDFNVEGDFSICLKINKKEYTNINKRFLTKTGGGTEIEVVLGTNSGFGVQNFVVFYNRSTTLQSVVFNYLIPQNQIVHLAYTKSGNQHRLYVNAVLYETITRNITPRGANTQPLLIGTRSALDIFFQIVWYDLKIVTRALTQGEITSIYKKKGKIGIENSILDVRFERNLQDSSVNPKTITPIGFPNDVITYKNEKGIQV